jgi:hypothetical protein
METQTDQQMLAEILENSRKTKNYMKWQLIITVALVVLPLLATVAIIPFVLNSVTSLYGAGQETGEATSALELLK